MKKESCPCGSGKAYAKCCGPIVEGQAQAQVPEVLMRSRYTAFCLENVDYLIASLAPEKRLGQEDWIRQELATTIAATRWLRLEVVDCSTAGDNYGVVEFIAFFEQAGAFGQLHERSVFVRVQGKWFYQDGEILAPVAIGRNQPCVCGSGKKFKRCHGRFL